MELIINLKYNATHNEGFSYHNHNYYKLKTSVFGMEYIRVTYYELSNNYDIDFGNMNDGSFNSNYTFNAECNGTILTIYLE